MTCPFRLLYSMSFDVRLHEQGKIVKLKRSNNKMLFTSGTYCFTAGNTLIFLSNIPLPVKGDSQFSSLWDIYVYMYEVIYMNNKNFVSNRCQFTTNTHTCLWYYVEYVNYVCTHHNSVPHISWHNGWHRKSHPLALFYMKIGTTQVLLYIVFHFIGIRDLPLFLLFP